ncbi:coniferyl aldehyde dehydrogenase [Niveibacterium terrae]|uniref:coniferyl aldehyde dehydrogenase n=1 Tax=Niveibacterium terrae TaxID=3373598 RepID=UPI003A8F0E4D
MNSNAVIARLGKTLSAMKRAHLADGPANAALRRNRLERAIRLLSENRAALIEAVSEDFGHRSGYQTLLADVMSSIAALHNAHKHLEQWMQPEEQEAPGEGMQARVQYQALGVVGIISPWNFPINLAFSPLSGVLAAGNRALIKPSELTPRTAALLAELVKRYFDPLELSVVQGDATVGAAFSAQPFDHLVFTGSTAVGRQVMRAAAENLVPLTLELGGKSPVMIDTDADLSAAVERTLSVKTFNVGQICLSPDYVLLPESAREAFVDNAQRFVREIFPSMQANPDYTSIINERHFLRLQGLLEDAQAKGATLVSLAPEGEPNASIESRKMAPVLVLGARDDMKVMQEEIFGPILPILTYQDRNQALDYINAHPRPLAAYYFGPDPERQQHFATQTTSGALVINDIMTHASVESLPFGGVGPAGMGAYHGVYGFRRFSHAKAVVVQSAGGEYNLRLRAPYAEKLAHIEAMLSA